MADNELIKRIVLIALAVFILIYGYLAWLLNPLHAEKKRLIVAAEKQRAGIEGKKLELHKLRLALKDEAERARESELVERMLQTTISAPLVYAPGALDEAMTKFGGQKERIQPALVMPLAGVPEARLFQWTWAGRFTGARSVGEMIADLENKWPLTQVSSFSLEMADGELKTRVDLQMVTRK